MLSKLSDLFFFCSQESKFSTVKEIFFDQQIFPGKEFFLGQGNFPQSRHFSTVKEVFRGYHYYTTSFNKAWTQVLRRFKSCRRRVRDSRRWGSLTMVPAENKAKRLSSVNHTARTIHHHHHHHHHQGSLKDKILDPFNTKSDAKIFLNFFFYLGFLSLCKSWQKYETLHTWSVLTTDKIFQGRHVSKVTWLLTSAVFCKFFFALKLKVLYIVEKEILYWSTFLLGPTSENILRSNNTFSKSRSWCHQFLAKFFLPRNLKCCISLNRKFCAE